MIVFLMLAAQVAAAPPPVFVAAPIDAAELGQTTAREDLSIAATSAQAATVSNNSVSGTTVTGSVTIDGNAFQNAQGLTLINANSGNNVAINSSLNVAISFGPPVVSAP